MGVEGDKPGNKEEFLLELYTETFYPGIILEADAFTSDGRKLVTKGDPITREVIDQLKSENIECLYYSLPEISDDELVNQNKYIVVEMDIKSLYPGIALKGDAYKPDGTLLVRKGEPITAEIIRNLEQHEIHKFNYNKPIFANKRNITTQKYIVSNELIEKSLYIAKEIEKCILNKIHLPKAEIDSIIEKMVGEISISETYTILNLLKIKDFDDITYVHSINVSMLAILFGKTLLYDPEKLKLLGVGGILHDLGKLMIPKEILNKKDRLTDKEWSVLQKHPVYGYDIIKTQKDFHTNVEKCLLWHHENFDGTGYPLQINRDKIGEIVQIIALADYYDAMTSIKPYRSAYPPWYSFLSIQNQSGKKFHPRFVTEFINKMPSRLYGKPVVPLNSYVMLDTKEIARVIKIDYSQTLRPIIIIYINSRKETLKYPLQVVFNWISAGI